MSALFASVATLAAVAGGGEPMPVRAATNVIVYRSVSWGDFDSDGLLDAYALMADGSGHLLRNLGDGQFEDVTSRSGIDLTVGGHLAMWSDYDADGHLDLFLAASGGASRLLRQSVEGTFEDVTSGVGLAGLTDTLDATWLDYDKDGNPDLYVTTLTSEHVFHNAGAGVFEELDLSLATPLARRLAVDSIRVDAPRGADAAGAAGSGGTSSSAPPPPGVHVDPGPGSLATPALAICAHRVDDMANPGNCLMASSVATLGMLYPMSSELFVDSATGNVGMGTTSPAHELDVVGDVRASGQLISTVGAGAPLAVSSTSVVPNLNADLLDGIHASAFSQLGSQIETAEIEDDAVTGPKIAPGAVGASEVADDSLTADDLATGAVGTTEVADDSLTADDLATGAVGTSEVADDSLTADDLATGAVGTTEVADDSLTADDLATGSVGTSEVADDSLTADDLAEGSVGASEIATGAVGSLAILDGTLVDADVSATAAIAGTKVVPNFGVQNLTTFGEGVFNDGGPGNYAVKGVGSLGPTLGHLGVQGADDFEGVITADWLGNEMGVVGISTGASATDNYGVMGHSNNAGVRGEHSSDPADDWGQLGNANVGVLANGDTAGVQATNSFSALSLGQLGAVSFGVAGEGSSAGGRFGNAADASLLDGCRGETSNPSGHAVWGHNSATTGSVACGVYGQTSSAMSFGVFASGGFGGTGAKYFVNPHPSDPTKEIRFISLEGNESGTYFRGTTEIVGGLAVIEVPEEFRMVTSGDNLSVQLTAVGAPALLWVESQDLDEVVVHGNMDVTFHYTVNGVRRGFANHPLVYENGSYLPERAGEVFGTQYPDAYREILVENGILNADFTPNVQTLAFLETQLAHYKQRMDANRAQEALEAFAAEEVAREAAQSRPHRDD